MDYTHIIVGGGSSGCVMASRLSEDAANMVLLIEAGRDTEPDRTPADILDTYAGLAMSNGEYFWPQLRASMRQGNHIPPPHRTRTFFHQARLLGGGSSINAQIALRGRPDDFNRWRSTGVRGWDWEDVLPYFKKLETDLDFDNGEHGESGPIPIKRVPRDQWDPFTQAVTRAWTAQGYSFLEDMNAQFMDGYAAVPFSNDGSSRWSAARGYLGNKVRSRANLEILTQTEVTTLLLDERRAAGVECIGRSGKRHIKGRNVILTAGTLHTPKLLMLSGIGPGERLQELGIRTLADLPGVGANLQDHPSVYVSCFLPPQARPPRNYRGPATYLRYSSGVENTSESDMIMISAGRSGWHEIGQRLGTLVAYVGLPYSRGKVTIASRDPGDSPLVDFNFLDDERDRVRLVDGFARASSTLRCTDVSPCAHHPFPTTFSERVAKVSRPTLRNGIALSAAGFVMDMSSSACKLLIEKVIAEAPTLRSLEKDAQALADYVCSAAQSIWHPVGTCKMGASGDSLAVADSSGAVFGLGNLRIADASLMPLIPSTNTNIPVLMMAEKIADSIMNGRPITDQKEEFIYA